MTQRLKIYCRHFSVSHFSIVLTDSDFPVSVAFYFPVTVIVTVDLSILSSYFAVTVTVNFNGTDEHLLS
jgi:hypothetical protein